MELVIFARFHAREGEESAVMAALREEVAAGERSFLGAGRGGCLAAGRPRHPVLQ
jgi:hypothetical protein